MRKVLTSGIFGFLCLALLFPWNAGTVLALQNIEEDCTACHSLDNPVVTDPNKQFDLHASWHTNHIGFAASDCLLCHPGSVGAIPIPTVNCTLCHPGCSMQDFHTFNQTYNDNVVGSTCAECHQQCAQPGDTDGDGVPDDGDNSGTPGDNPCPDGVTFGCDDNCPDHPNGPLQGICTKFTPSDGNYIVSNGQYCFDDGDCDDGEECEMEQADHYPSPPYGTPNGVGDACDCEGNLNGDFAVDAGDVAPFLAHWNKRLSYFNPCTNGDPCNGDFNCDAGVDAGDVPKFIEDWNKRLGFPAGNPCPPQFLPWCDYPE